jgi:hypothetical protein
MGIHHSGPSRIALMTGVALRGGRHVRRRFYLRVL